jgi:multiple sugar transport system ATP-binding protein
MVFQNHALYPHLTARENIAFGLKLRKHPAAEISERVSQAVEMLGLRDCLDRRPEALSGGERQRVALGRALVRQPKVFLLDEPLSDLDAPMRMQMRREIARLHKRLGTTMIYVTHDQVEAMTLGDRIAVMHQGTLQQIAQPMDLYHQPANRFVAGFIGSPAMNFFSGAIWQNGAGLLFESEEMKLRVNEGMAGQVGRKVVLGIRPEHVSEAGDASSSEKVEVVVDAMEPTGAETNLHGMIGDQSLVARLRADSRAAARQKVSLVFDMRHAHFFDATTERRISA